MGELKSCNWPYFDRMYEVGKSSEVPMRFEADEDVENGVLRDAGHDQEHVDNGHVDLKKM